MMQFSKSRFFAAAIVIATLMPPPHARAAGEVVATFASGCLWCVESDFDLVPGLIRTISGYTGGMLKDPTYRKVSADNSGHIKSVRIYFDPKMIS